MLRQVEHGQCLYVEEIFEDAATCLEPSVWGCLSTGGWIVLLAKAAGDQGFIRARPYCAEETAKAIERLRATVESGRPIPPDCIPADPYCWLQHPVRTS